MMPRFENGVKFFLFLLLTFQNVSSKSYSNNKLKPADVLGPSRLAKDDQDPSERISDQAQEKPRQNWATEVLERVTLPSRDERNDLSKESSYVKQLLSLGKTLQLVKGQEQTQNHGNRGNFLSRLLETKNGPVVVFLTPGTDKDLNGVSDSQSSEDKNNKSEDESDEKVQKYEGTPGENDAYVLYNVLRTTQEDENLDPKANEAFEKTKSVLRQAFALRCGAKSACEQKCPEKKPKCPLDCQKEKRQVKKSCQRKCDERPTCEKKCIEKKVDECEEKVDECQEKQEKKCEDKCQETYDELDACPKPKKKCGPKCGKTMPPYWLLRAGDLE